MNDTSKARERARADVDNATFELTVLPHEAMLLRRARRLVGAEADALDLVQETLERALRTFHAFRPGTATWAWLRTIMNSVWIDGWRRSQVAQRIKAFPPLELVSPEAEPAVALPDGQSDADVEMLLARLPAAIARLPPVFRQVLELRLVSNWSYGDIAGRLGIPSRTVGTRLLRARRQLRTMLENELSVASPSGSHVPLTPRPPQDGRPRKTPAARARKEYRAHDGLDRLAS